MPTSPLATALLTDPSYGVVPSVRAPQLALLDAMRAALDAGEALAAEAGTGVGKTAGYASQAVEWLLAQPAERCRDGADADAEDAEDEEGRKIKPRYATVVIATATKALQTQIVTQELPRLVAGVIAYLRANGASEQEIATAHARLRFAKRVGKANHLCARRLYQAAARRPEVKKQLPIYEDFMDRVPGWVRDDAPVDRPLPEDAVKYAVGYCNPSSCGYVDACESRGYRAAREAAEEASILVTNHALVAADMIVRRRENCEVLPPAVDVFFLDEAHKLPDALREALTITFSSTVWTKHVQSYGQLIFDLGDDGARYPQSLPRIMTVRSACAEFLRSSDADLHATSTRYAEALDVACDQLLSDFGAPTIEALRSRISDSSEWTAHGTVLREIGTFLTTLRTHRDALGLMLEDPLLKGFFILHAVPSDVAGEPPAKMLVPTRMGGYWKAYLNVTEATPVYVSATLATGVGREGPFAPFLDEVGDMYNGKPVRTFVAGSPFDYASQAVLYAPRDSPDPNTPDEAEYARQLVAAALPLLLANEGHAFVLFTSKTKLRAFETALGEVGYPYPILSQESNAQLKANGAAIFKSTPNATLLGLKTFFEGIDIPGLGLSLVIIPKLPFPFPDPVLAAKRARYPDRAGFMSVDVPVMLTDLRQMAGRLVRTVDDRGAVAILDPRVHTKGYGADVLRALRMPTIRHTATPVVRFLENVAARRAGRTG